MNAEIKAKWLTALRSGKYAQARDKLRKADGFCCLGVLCDVIDPAMWRPAAGGWRYDGMDTYLPSGVREAAGISRPTNENDDDEGALVNMNDGGKSFAEIADYIEKHL